MSTLAIAIATLPERATQLRRLLDHLTSQGPFEALIDDRPRGTVSVGAKRQALNMRATADYIVHIDDDDWTSDTYLADIYEALEGRPDSVGGYELVQGIKAWPEIACWTNRAPRWLDGQRAAPYHASYVRTPGHKTPIRTAIAQAIAYRDMGFGEDQDYSRRLKAAGLIRTEAFIPKVLQHYRYVHKPRTSYA